MEILTRCRKLAEDTTTQSNFVKPQGLMHGKDIFITPGPFFQVYSTILHEWGHVIGTAYSKEDCLTPYECSNRFSYCFDDSDLDYIISEFIDGKNIEASGKIVTIAEKVLTYYLKEGTPPEVNIHNVSSDYLIERRHSAPEDDYMSNGVIKNTRLTRNLELSAQTVEYGCLMLTEKMLADYLLKKHYMDRFEYNLITVPVPDSDPYRRSQNIIAWAKRAPNRKIPTTKDLGLDGRS